MAKELNSGILITSGLTDVIATPYLLGVAQAAIACTEIGTTKMYHADMAGAAGTYIVKFTSASAPLNQASGEIIWDGTQEVTAGTVPAAVLSANAARLVDGTITGGIFDKTMLAFAAGKRRGLVASGIPALEEYLRQDAVTAQISLSPTDAAGNGTPVINQA